MAAEEKVKQLTPGTLINGKYSVEKTLGVGGMGAVYQALHIEIGRRVAIKLLNPSLVQNDEMLARFRREAKAAAIIGHPGIVDVYDIGTAEDGSPFIVMEYLDGVTLSQQIKAKGRLPVHEAVGYACEVLDALVSAHKAGIVHRDLKPGNIFITEKARVVKVLDFGISKFHGMDEDLSLTKTGVSMGTPLYMSPEQIRDTRLAGAPSDLYAVGAILYRSMSGKPPFQAETYGQMIAKVLTEMHVPLDELVPEVPGPVARVVDRLLAKKPELRPRDALETKNELMRAMAESMDGGAALAVVSMVSAEPAAVTRDDETISAKRAKAQTALSGQVAQTTQTGAETHGATADVRKIDPTRKRWLLTAGVGAVLIAGMVGLVLRLSHPSVDKPVAPQIAPVVDNTPALPKDVKPIKSVVTLRLIAEPAFARWRVDGADLNCNPCEIERNKGEGAAAQAEAPGYVAQTTPVRFDQNHDVRLELVRAPLNVTRPKEKAAKNKDSDPFATPKTKRHDELNIDRNNPFN